MKVKDLIAKVKKMDYPQKLERGWEGLCPCFNYNPTIDGHKISIHGHCWRTTDNGIDGGCECAFNGLHIKGKLPKKDLMEIAKSFKAKLDKQKWYSEWEVVVTTASEVFNGEGK
jgi:hypothetical protein